jgi:hypothetical protein
MEKRHGHVDFDEHMGAVEGERPGDPQPGNANAGALDEQGLPMDADRIAADVIGAQNDETGG